MAEQPSGIAVVSPKIRDAALVRKFVSQYGLGYIALNVRNASGGVDPDADTLALNLYYLDPNAAEQPTDDPRGSLVLTTSDVVRDDLGYFHYDIGPENTAERGVLTAEWTYQVGGKSFKFVDHLQVLEPMPYYDQLDPERRSLVEQVSWMFGDLFDSEEGGPHLIDEFQTHFNYDMISRLMSVATTRMNTIGFPIQTWSLFPVTPTSQAGYPPSTFSGLLVWGTYLEVIRHLRDSYVEVPNRPNMNVTYLDRTQYSQRWGQILAAEWPEYIRAIKMAKRKLLNLGRGSLLVAGGIFGGGAGGLFIPGMYSAAARGFRFYPAAPSIAFSSQTAVGR